MRKSKEELMAIWVDTESRFSDYEFKIESYRTKSKDIKFIPLYKLDKSYISSECNITVQNQDCMVVANELSKLGKTCMLNMASYKHPGGGVIRGAMSQEEELARRSNMMMGLTLHGYPLAKNDVIYLNDVTFFKDGNYSLITPFDCDVITIAAINLNNLAKPADYEELTLHKIKNMLTEPAVNGCSNLVLSAFGCGVFKNDPTYIASVFKSVINDVSYLYDNIAFAVINDKNSVANNYEIFKSIIEG